jgi:hypothetical protein
MSQLPALSINTHGVLFRDHPFGIGRTLTIAMLLAATAGDSVSLRIFTLLFGSAVVGMVAGCLVYIATDGAAKKKIAAGVLTGFVAFAGAYKFLDTLVPN